MIYSRLVSDKKNSDALIFGTSQKRSEERSNDNHESYIHEEYITSNLFFIILSVLRSSILRKRIPLP